MIKKEFYDGFLLGDGCVQIDRRMKSKKARATCGLEHEEFCEYLIGLAVGLGIKVYIPLNSDLMRVGFQYGYDDPTEMSIKIKQKNVELLRKKQGAEQSIRSTNDGLQRIIGALELNTYYGDNYVNMVISSRFKNQ